MQGVWFVSACERQLPTFWLTLEKVNHWNSIEVAIGILRSVPDRWIQQNFIAEETEDPNHNEILSIFILSVLSFIISVTRAHRHCTSSLLFLIETSKSHLTSLSRASGYSWCWRSWFKFTSHQNNGSKTGNGWMPTEHWRAKKKTIETIKITLLSSSLKCR